jgi:hypothetical protein
MNIKAHALLLSLGALTLSVQANAAPDVLPDGSFLYRMAQTQVEASRTTARLAETRRQATRIKIGTSRAQIERLFPSQDGGLMASVVTRYYVGNGVMVDVPYDQRGGPWKAQNRVRGPLRVYLSSFHSD